MTTYDQIKAFSDALARQFKPVRIILFGSYAAGRPTPDSDVDMLVVLRHTGKAARKALEILNSLDPRFPIDLIVRSPEQLHERIANGDFFLREITEKGKVLYEAADTGVGGKG